MVIENELSMETYRTLFKDYIFHYKEFNMNESIK